MKKKTVNTRFLVELAVLIAIELLLEITGLGYIKTGFLSFTIMQVPVIVGAIVLGPLAGAILGIIVAAIFLLAIFCGMLMFIAVDIFKTQQGSTLRFIGIFVPVISR